jgi:serine/threonine protein kinase
MGSFREEEEDNDEISSSHSSSDSSSSSYSSSYASSSSSDGSSRQRRRRHQQGTIVDHEKEDDYFFRFSSLLRHRRTKSTTISVDDDRCQEEEERRRKSIDVDDEKYGYGYNSSSSNQEYYDSSSSKNNKRRKGRIRATQKRDGTTRRREFHWSSRLLGLSLLVWSGVQIASTKYMQQQQSLWYIGNVNNIDQTQERRRQQNHQQQQQYDENHYGNNNHNPHRNSSSPGHPHRPPKPLTKNKKKGSEKEKLAPGCELDPTWQTPDSNSKLLSCQILHELDLTEALASSGSSSGSSSSSSSSSRRRRSISSSAHLGSGLWRDVWKVRDNYIDGSNHNHNLNTNNYVVLKTMKSEHEVITRNLERHRREASSLNTLTGSPYVTDLYGYCGNSILTEFATQDLSHALNNNNKNNNINDSERRRKIKDANRMARAKEYKESLPLRIHDNYNSTTNTAGDDIENEDDNKESDSSTNNNNTGIPKFSTVTSSSPVSLEIRLDWALQVSKAVADLHRSDIIHADITTKQFLVVHRSEDNDNSNNNTARIKINDFNRCRFVPRRQQNHNASTTMNSTINIDTAMNSTWSKSTDICKIRIPSAPGKYRSPEEYSDKPLTTQMDVYSLGHVLYEIWTSGQNPWYDVGAKRIKNMVMDGSLPVELKKLEEWDVDASVEKSFEADDRAFGLLIRECYRVDPKRRITADGLVEELTKLLTREYKKKD